MAKTKRGSWSKCISFLKNNQILYRVCNKSIGHIKIWNPYSESWIFYYVFTKTVCDSCNNKIGKVEPEVFKKFSMKDKTVKW